MITLTAEQAQQIEEALEDIVRVFNFETGTPVEALAVIRAARAQTNTRSGIRSTSEHSEQTEREPVEIVVEVDRHGDATVVCGAWQLDGGTHTFYAAPQPVKQKPVAFKFVRYVDGKEMAEGVTIEREKTLDAAIKKAVALCPNRDKTVLVYATPVRTKDLTKEEIQNAMMPIEPTGKDYFLRLARAVIAKFKEKNKC